MMNLGSNDFLSILKKSLSIDVKDFAALKVALRSRDPFQLLIMTILTQNTSDKNATKAFENLSRKFPITPKSLASASIDDIAEAIKPAGMFRKRARVIKDVSRAILEKFGGDLRKVFEYPLGDARNLLINLPGIGRKTADVLLLFIAGMPTFPVDTHINRVSKRLGLASERATYEDVRRSLMGFFEPSRYLDAHLLLIAFGRKYCKARNPLCASCPLKDVCRYYSKARQKPKL